MKNLKNKIFNLYNLLFLTSFFLARSLPFLFFFYGAHVLNSNQYVELENIIAIASFLIAFFSFGMTSVITVIKQSQINLNLIYRHVQITSLILFIISSIFHFLDQYFISNISNVLIVLLITHSLSSYLKINTKRIYGLFSECFFYLIISLFFLFLSINDLFDNNQILLKNFLYILSILFIASHFIIYGQKIFIHCTKKNFQQIYKRSYGLLISGIILSFLSLYPRLFIKFFPEYQQFDFLFTYRIIFLGMIIHQIFSTFFFRNIFKSNWIYIIKLIILIVTLTLIASLSIMIFYIYLNNNFFFNLNKIDFNYLMIIQIFLLSLINYINIIMLRSKKSIFFYNKIIFIIFLISIVSFLIFKFNNLDIFYLSICHIFVMIFYLFYSTGYLIKFILPKNIKIIKL